MIETLSIYDYYFLKKSQGVEGNGKEQEEKRGKG